MAARCSAPRRREIPIPVMRRIYRPTGGGDNMTGANAVLSSAAILLTAVALLRIGVAVVQPIFHLFPSPSGTSPQLSGRRRRR